MRRISISLVAAACVAAASGQAFAGGFELQEQSASALGVGAAFVARADDPSAIYYNPAGMAFQRGYGGMAGINILHADTDVTVPGSTGGSSSHTSVAPTLYATQRLGPHFAVGIGAFTNFGQHFNFDQNFSGRFLGYFFDLTTATINPSVAIRPIPRIAIGFGLDIVPASFELRQSLNFGGGEGTIHAGASAVGFGGNVGLMIILMPKYLTFGASFRSLIDLDFGGDVGITAPPELRAMTGGLKHGDVGVTLPHNFSFGLASHPLPNLIVSSDFHLTLWHDLQGLTLTITDPTAPTGTPPTKQTTVLDWSDSVGLRAGVEYRVLDGKLALRVGGGFDWTPVPAHTMSPLAPDANRGIATLGLGYRGHGIGADVGYLAAILLDRTSTNPDYVASYHSIGHVVAINVWIRAEELFGRLDVPAYKN